MQLREYQIEAAKFLVANERAMVLAQVGAGKTAITIEAMKQVGGRWLVLAPKRVATDVWPQEARKWLGDTVPVRKLLHGGYFIGDMMTYTQIHVTNYETIHKLADLSLYTGVVFDELTRLKNPSGKRFKMLEKLLKDADVKYRWGLTGSFTSNGLEDVYGQCKIVDSKLLGRSKGAFLQQYFHCINRDFGQWAPAPGALEQVMERIKPATYVLEADEYADTLPPLHTVEVRCDLDDRKPYDDMKREYVADLGDQTITALSAAAVTTKLQQMAGGWVYHAAMHIPLGGDVGQSSSGRYAAWFSTHKFDRLAELLEENQRANTIVFYNFKEEYDELKRRHPSAVAVTDDGAIDKWNAGKVEILLAHPKSASHGLNLQFGGSQMVFLSLPWSLELYEQAIGRLHRSGQKHPVWVYILLTNKTIDDRMFTGLHEKRSTSDIALAELKGT